ncbi:hypothetical protein JCGZ_09689 [Jatropha curcas]|uniref:MYB family protein n=1 Tax=Jatropha curcas TaxID=180498 RepID=A0A067LL30_JATCU|nr:MYB family protein [Jatropha curcas]KDP45440.1 hypothetical protein JCGZ_09689 [Jatropha curcas]
MGRPPCCDKSNVKRGLWTAEEDAKILAYVSNHGIGNWTLVPKKAGLNRCGKSCRLRWTNYLRPDLKHDNFTPQEEELIINLHKAIGTRWSLIAKQLPGRTDNDVKNYWNTKLRKKLTKMGIDPVTHKPFSQILSDYGKISGISSNTTGNQVGSFTNNALNNSSNDVIMISKPEPSSSSSVLTTTGYSSSSNLMKNDELRDSFIMQPHFYNEVSSSCSSSSSPYPQLAVVTPSPCLWSEFLLSDPVISAEFQQQEQDTCNGSGNNDDDQFFNGNGYGVINSNYQGNNCGEAASSSSAATSFVDGILDKDRELGSQFPQLLDSSFDY